MGRRPSGSDPLHAGRSLPFAACEPFVKASKTFIARDNAYTVLQSIGLAFVVGAREATEFSRNNSNSDTSLLH